MKRIIFALICIIFLFVASEAWASAFCEGWHDGYIAGYCYRKVSCIPPIVPICPIPRIGEDTYMDGYNRGFLAGLNAQR